MVPYCCQVQSKLWSQFLGLLCLWQCLECKKAQNWHGQQTIVYGSINLNFFGGGPDTILELPCEEGSPNPGYCAALTHSSGNWYTTHLDSNILLKFSNQCVQNQSPLFLSCEARQLFSLAQSWPRLVLLILTKWSRSNLRQSSQPSSGLFFDEQSLDCNTIHFFHCNVPNLRGGTNLRSCSTLEKRCWKLITNSGGAPASA